MTFHPFYVVNPLALACPLKNGTSSKTVATGRDGGSQTAKKHSRCFSLFKEVQPSETRKVHTAIFQPSFLWCFVIQYGYSKLCNFCFQSKAIVHFWVAPRVALKPFSMFRTQAFMSPAPIWSIQKLPRANLATGEPETLFKRISVSDDNVHSTP